MSEAQRQELKLFHQRPGTCSDFIVTRNTDILACAFGPWNKRYVDERHDRRVTSIPCPRSRAQRQVPMPCKSYLANLINLENLRPHCSCQI